MTKTNAAAKTATRTAKAKAPAKDNAAVVSLKDKLAFTDPHALTPAKKAKLAKQAVTMAKRPKSSAQTGGVELGAADKAQIAAEAADRQPKPRRGKVMRDSDFTGPDPVAIGKQIAKELAMESEAQGTVRAFDMITTTGKVDNWSAKNDYYRVASDKGTPIMVPGHLWVGKVAEAAKLGMSYKAFKAVYESEHDSRQGKLASGLDGRNAPQSAASVAKHRGSAKATNKADAVTQKAPAPAKAAKEARKAKRAETAAPKADDTRKIAVVDKKFTYGKEGTSRRASWDACTKAKTVADYAAAGGAVKYLPRWVAAGAIKLG